MVKKTATKNEFSQLNDKKFYFPDGIVSLPFGHQNLKEIGNFKKEKGKKIEKYFWEEKEVLLNMERKSFEKHGYIVPVASMSPPKIFNISKKKISCFTRQKKDTN